MDNPFSPSFPVNPAYFVNRKEAMESFETAIARSHKGGIPTPDNIAILGKWGVGKSSLLRKFEAAAMAKTDKRYFSTIVELVPASCNDFEGFASKTIDDIYRNCSSEATVYQQIRTEIKD